MGRQKLEIVYQKGFRVICPRTYVHWRPDLMTPMTASDHINRSATPMSMGCRSFARKRTQGRNHPAEPWSGRFCGTRVALLAGSSGSPSFTKSRHQSGQLSRMHWPRGPQCCVVLACAWPWSGRQDSKASMIADMQDCLTIPSTAWILYLLTNYEIRVIILSRVTGEPESRIESSSFFGRCE